MKTYEELKSEIESIPFNKNWFEMPEELLFTTSNPNRPVKLYLQGGVFVVEPFDKVQTGVEEIETESNPPGISFVEERPKYALKRRFKSPLCCRVSSDFATGMWLMETQLKLIQPHINSETGETIEKKTSFFWRIEDCNPDLNRDEASEIAEFLWNKYESIIGSNC